MQEDFKDLLTHPATQSPSSLIPYDRVVLHVAFKKMIDLHPCFSHIVHFLEFVYVCVSLHPCYLGFVKSFKNTNLSMKFMERV